MSTEARSSLRSLDLRQACYSWHLLRKPAAAKKWHYLALFAGIIDAELLCRRRLAPNRPHGSVPFFGTGLFSTKIEPRRTMHELLRERQLRTHRGRNLIRLQCLAVGYFSVRRSTSWRHGLMKTDPFRRVHKPAKGSALGSFGEFPSAHPRDIAPPPALTGCDVNASERPTQSKLRAAFRCHRRHLASGGNPKCLSEKRLRVRQTDAN